MGLAQWSGMPSASSTDVTRWRFRHAAIHSVSHFDVHAQDDTKPLIRWLVWKHSSRLIAMLLGMMLSISDDQGLLQMKAALHDAINRRFAYVKTAPHIIVATLLDPHFKDA